MGPDRFGSMCGRRWMQGATDRLRMLACALTITAQLGATPLHALEHKDNGSAPDHVQLVHRDGDESGQVRGGCSTCQSIRQSRSGVEPQRHVEAPCADPIRPLVLWAPARSIGEWRGNAAAPRAPPWV